MSRWSARRTMAALVASLFLLQLGGCAGRRQVATVKVPPPPMRQAPKEPAAPRTTDDAASEAYLQRSIDAAVQESERAEAERRERLRWQDEQRLLQRVYVTPYRGGVYYGHQHYHRRSYVPWNAIVLGSVGAAIGHRHGRRGPHGFLLGSSIGLVLDSLRW